MARYKVTWTIYKDPRGKTLKGPTFLHALGDICSALGLMGILYVILGFMEHWGAGQAAGGAVAAAAGIILSVVLHKKAKKDAEAAFLKILAQQEGQAKAD